jgi:WD40 repeat protein
MDVSHEPELPEYSLDVRKRPGRVWRWLFWLAFPPAVLILTFAVSARVMPSVWHGWHDRDMRVLDSRMGVTEVVRFSPDGKTLYSLSADDGLGYRSFLIVWDVATGRELRRVEARSPLALSHDGELLAAGCRERGRVQLWDTRTWARLGEVDTGSESVDEVALSPDNRMLATASHVSHRQAEQEAKPPGKLTLWDVGSGKAVASFRGSSIRSVAFSPDHSYLVASIGRAVHVYETEAWSRQATLVDGNEMGFLVRRLVFSRDGKYLAAMTTDGVRVWEVDGWRFAVRIPALGTGLDEHVDEVAFAPDGRLLAVGGFYRLGWGLKGGVVEFWEVDGWRRRGQRSPHRWGICGLDISPDGTTVATGCRGDGGIGLSPVP